MFTLHKRIVLIVVSAERAVYVDGWLGNQRFLPVLCQCMFSLMKLIVNNQEIFQTHSLVHSTSARNEHYLHRPNASLSCFQKKCILCWHQDFQQYNTHCH
jgi:hypothetical protein